MKLYKLSVSVMLIFSFYIFSSCSNSSAEEDTVSGFTQEIIQSSVISDSVTQACVTTTEVCDTEITSAENEITNKAAASETTTKEQAPMDISMLNDEEIVSFYRTAAAKTGTSIQSEQTVELSDISVNNGALGGVFSFVTPILSDFLAEKVTVTDGITGEYELLTAQDTSLAKAYETAKGTVIEMTLRGHSETADTSSSTGSTAHGITVVGDFAGIMQQLKQAGLPLDIPSSNAVITYSQPEIKVLIDSNGKIVNGTWTCVVEISITDYKFAGAKVDSTSVVLKNTITAGGGFSS